MRTSCNGMHQVDVHEEQGQARAQGAPCSAWGMAVSKLVLDSPTHEQGRKQKRVRGRARLRLRVLRLGRASQQPGCCGRPPRTCLPAFPARRRVLQQQTQWSEGYKEFRKPAVSGLLRRRTTLCCGLLAEEHRQVRSHQHTCHEALARAVGRRRAFGHNSTCWARHPHG